jgi:hypothetical protein
MLVGDEAFWLLYVDLLVDVGVKKGCGNVHEMDGETVEDSESE